MEQPIIPRAEVPDTGAVAAEFFGRRVLATAVDGRREGEGLVCEWHNGEFGLDGRCRRGPARADSRVSVLPTRVIDGTVVYVYTAPGGTPGAHEDDAELAARVDQ